MSVVAGIALLVGSIALAAWDHLHHPPVAVDVLPEPSGLSDAVLDFDAGAAVAAGLLETVAETEAAFSTDDRLWLAELGLRWTA